MNGYEKALIAKFGQKGINIEVHGDSMLPVIKPGMKVLILPQNEYKYGDIAIQYVCMCKSKS